MFYKMIENKCTQWYESEQCTVKNLVEYIEKTGQMRDAQIEAIKVYLFLKITCECKPLTQLFRQGFFNSIDLNEIELSKSTREYLFQNPAAAALFEYACLKNDKGEQVSEKLEKQILRDLKTILDDVVIGDYAEFHAEEIADGYAVTIDKFISDRVLSKITEFNQKAFLNSSAKKPYKPIEISEEGLELIEFLSLDCTATDGEWHSESEIKIDKNGYVIVDGNKTKEFWDGCIRSTNKPLRLKIRNICGDETVWEV